MLALRTSLLKSIFTSGWTASGFGAVKNQAGVCSPLSFSYRRIVVRSNRTSLANFLKVMELSTRNILFRT